MTIHQLDPDEATRTVRQCLCSSCWGQLVSRYDYKSRKSIVSCSAEGCPCDGFVSRHGVEIQEANSRGELMDAKIALRNILPQTLPQDEAGIIKSLGF